MAEQLTPKQWHTLTTHPGWRASGPGYREAFNAALDSAGISKDVRMGCGLRHNDLQNGNMWRSSDALRQAYREIAPAEDVVLQLVA